jgi:hypothetical protein
MGIPEYEAKRYEGRVKEGGILVSVHCDSSEEISRAKDILKATGADDIASAGESSHGVDSKYKDPAYVDAEPVGPARSYGKEVIVEEPRKLG